MAEEEVQGSIEETAAAVAAAAAVASDIKHLQLFVITAPLHCC